MQAHTKYPILLTPTSVGRVHNPTSKLLGSKAGYSITDVLQEALLDVAIQQRQGIRKSHDAMGRYVRRLCCHSQQA